MKTIIAKIPRQSLKVFEFYAEEFGIPVSWLMQSECCSEIITLVDAPFQVLERMDETPPPENPEIVALEFSPEAYSFLCRFSRLLRRPLDDLICWLLAASAEVIGAHLKDSPQLSEGVPDPDLKSWAKLAKEFQHRSQENLSPMLVNGVDCWDWCGIKNPAAAPNPVAAMKTGGSSAGKPKALA